MTHKSIKDKNIRYHIHAVLDFPADESIVVSDYLEHLQEVGCAAITQVEVVEANAPLPDLSGKEYADD